MPVWLTAVEGQEGIQWNLLITDTLGLCSPVLYMEISLTGRSKYIVNIITGTSVSCPLYRCVRNRECPLMEVPLYTSGVFITHFMSYCLYVCTLFVCTYCLYVHVCMFVCMKS